MTLNEMAKRARAAVCVRAHTTELDKFAALLAAAEAAAGELPDPLLLPSPCALRFCPRLADALSAIFPVRRDAEGHDRNATFVEGNRGRR